MSGRQIILLMAAALALAGGAAERVVTDEQVFRGDRLLLDFAATRTEGRVRVRLYERNHARHSLLSDWMSDAGSGRRVPFPRGELQIFAGKPIRLEFELDGARVDAHAFKTSDFLITDFGAKPEGSNCTAAFAAAMAACEQAGGGRVIVPAGRWQTDVVNLRSECELRLEKGAEVVSAGCEPKGPLVAASCCTNVAICGYGTLGAGGVRFERCYAVTLDGFAVRRTESPAIVLDRSFYVNIRNLDIAETRTDGLLVDRTGNVILERCRFDLGGAAFVLRNGGEGTSVTRRVFLSDCSIVACERLLDVEGSSAQPVEDVQLGRLHLGCVRCANRILFADKLVLDGRPMLLE